MDIIKILNGLNEPTINETFLIKMEENNNISTRVLIFKYKNSGIKYLKTLKLKDLYKILKYTNEQYIKNNLIMSNVLYNNLKKHIIFKSDNYDAVLSDSFLKNYKTNA